MEFFKLCFKSIWSVCRVLRFGRWKIIIPSNDSSTTICNILGNGPSLNEEIENHIDEIENGELIVVNHFALSDNFEKFKPRYYVFADPGFWESPTDNSVLTTFRNINDKVTWRLSVFVPFRGKSFFDDFFTNNNITIHDYSTCSYYGGFNFLRVLLYNKNLCFPVCQNVLTPAIFIAIKLNFRIINLFGADNSWMKTLTVNENNKVCQDVQHFYDESKSEVGDQKTEKSFTMSFALLSLYWVFLGYEEIISYLHSIQSEQKIYNRTKGSYIDAFERKR